MRAVRALLIGLAVLALAGCAAERRVLSTHDIGIDVTVDDRTGWAVGASMVEPPPPWTSEDWNGRSVQVRNLDDAVLQVGWWGGPCSERVTVMVSGTEDALTIRVHNATPCQEQSARARVLRLTLDRAIDASKVDASEVDALPG